MKKAVCFLVIVVMATSFVQVACADGPVKKLGRGMANVVGSPFEITKGMGDAGAEGGPLAGMTCGLIKGSVNFVKRAAVGVYEIGTFPVPLPDKYEPILDDPEFFLEKRDYESEGAVR